MGSHCSRLSHHDAADRHHASSSSPTSSSCSPAPPQHQAQCTMIFLPTLMICDAPRTASTPGNGEALFGAAVRNDSLSSDSAVDVPMHPHPASPSNVISHQCRKDHVYASTSLKSMPCFSLLEEAAVSPSASEFSSERRSHQRREHRSSTLQSSSPGLDSLLPIHGSRLRPRLSGDSDAAVIATERSVGGSSLAPPDPGLYLGSGVSSLHTASEYCTSASSLIKQLMFDADADADAPSANSE